MKFVIHSVSPTPQPFLFTFPFLTAAPMCFLGWPVLFDMLWHGACMDHHFWHILTMWDWEHMCSKILRPQITRKTPAKIPQTRANPDFWYFRVIWVVLQTMHFWPCLKENEFNRSHAHSVCLNLPMKQQGLQPRTEPLLWIHGFLLGQSRCFSKDRLVFILWLLIAAFFYETPHYLKRLEISMQWKLEVYIQVYHIYKDALSEIGRAVSGCLSLQSSLRVLPRDPNNYSKRIQQICSWPLNHS